MKSARSATKSFKNLILKGSSNSTLKPNLDFGLTVIPTGSDNLFVELPRLLDSYTYNIINSDQMTGNIQLKTRNASLKGLVLNTMNNGNVQITPIEEGTVSFTMDNSISDGCYVQTLSNGDFWYVWSIATGGNIGLRRGGGAIVTITPTVVYNPPVFDSDPANAIVSTTTFPTVDALHTITQFNGTGPVGATLTLTEENFNTILDTVNGLTSVTVTVDVNGDWQYTPTQPIELGNGDYSFLINDLSGGGSASEVFYRDTGPITFTVPQSPILVEQGTIFNFISDTVAAAFDANGTPITVTVDTAATDGTETHGDTLSITYSINPSGTQIDRGPIEVQIYKQPPAAPVIDTASFTGLTLSSSGTAEAGSIIQVYFDGAGPISTQPHPIVADNTGAWSFDYYAGAKVTIGTLKVHAVDAHGQISGPSNTFGPLSAQDPPDAPSLSVDGEVSGQWTNTNNGNKEFTVEGTTTDPAATVTLFAGGVEITANTYPELLSGPTYDGAGGWSATIEAEDESRASLTARATLNGQTSSDCNPFSLKVDRLTPVITLNGANQTVGLPNVGAGNDLGIASVSNVYSGIDTQTSDWDSVVANQTTEGSVQVSYNVTDNAGNTAITVYRNVTITTEVIVPTITSVVDNGDGTLDVQGTVSGIYSGNLTVQVKVGGSDDGTASVNNETFGYTTTNLGNGTFAITAVTVNTAGEESSPSNEENTTISIQVNNPPVITLSAPTTVTFTEGGTYVEPGFTASDNEDGDLTNAVVTTVTDAAGNVAVLDSNTVPGSYIITYSVSDSAGLSATEVTRDVTVEAAFNFVEDLQSVIDRASTQSGRNIDTQTGIAQSRSTHRENGVNVDLDADGLVTYDSNGIATDLNWTISFWMKRRTDLGDNSNGNRHFFGRKTVGNANNRSSVLGLAGGFNHSSTQTLNTLTMQVGHPTGLFYKSSNVNFSNSTRFGNANVAIESDYVNFVIVSKVRSSDNKVDVDCYVNGISAFGDSHNCKGLPAGTQTLPDLAYERIAFGGVIGPGTTGRIIPGNVNDKSIMCDIESIQIVTGFSLHQAGAAALYAGGTTTTIADANQAAQVPPEIHLDGGNSIFHELGTAFTDPGFTATDQQDGDLTNEVTTEITDSNNNIISAIDANTPYGYYTITYSVADSTGASVSVDRDVEVNISNLFLEEFSSATSNLSSQQNDPLPTINQGIFSRVNSKAATEVAMKDDGVIAYTVNQPTNSDFTFSFWFRPDQDITTTDPQAILGKVSSSLAGADGTFVMAVGKNSAGKAKFKPSVGRSTGGLGVGTNAQNLTVSSTRDFTSGTWYHAAITYEFNSSTNFNELKVYIDGVKGTEKLDCDANQHILQDSFGQANNSNFLQRFGIGRTANSAALGNFLGSQFALSLDSIQFGDNVVLTASQVLAIYNQSDRRMSIATASGL